MTPSIPVKTLDFDGLPVLDSASEGNLVQLASTSISKDGRVKHTVRMPSVLQDVSIDVRATHLSTDLHEGKAAPQQECRSRLYTRSELHQALSQYEYNKSSK